MSPFKYVSQSIKDFPHLFFPIVFAEALQAVLLLILPFTVARLLDALTAPSLFNGDELAAQGLTQYEAIWAAAKMPFLYFIATVVAMLLAMRMAGLILIPFASYLRLKPRKRLMNYLQSHSITYFQDGQGGAIGSRLGALTTYLGHFLWVAIFDIWPVAVKLIGASVLILLTHTNLGLMLLVWSVLYLAVVYKLSIMKGQRIEHLSAVRANITGRVVDMASNIAVVKSFANEDHEINHLDAPAQGEVDWSFRVNYVREYIGFFHMGMTLCIMIGALYYCIDSYARGMISVGDIAFIFSLIFLLSEQVRGVGWAFAHLMEYYGQIADGLNAIFKPITLTDAADAQDLVIASSPSSSGADISFNHVAFQYDDVKTTFDDFNLTIPAGQKIGLVGHSGAGKTSLVNLLLRFYDIQGGAITINGQNIAHVTQKSLRQNIALIPQDTSLFHRTLMENIRYGRLDASDDEVIAAAKQAHAHDFITKLPGGYQTMVGERGVKLSGGQRQRIAIARAILKDAPILILDEATSALDSESEAAIQAALTSLMENKTVIVIAHRLSTIANLDRLIVLENGKIAQDGPHETLITQSSSTYATLWSMQSNGFLGD